MNIKIIVIYLALTAYLCWYYVFDSFELARLIDIHIHILRSHNLYENFKEFIFFPAWHNNILFGYPEDFNYISTYIILSFLYLFFPIPIAFKVLAFSSFLFGCFGTYKLSYYLFRNQFNAFTSGLLYIGSASFINFGLGSGSITRVLAIGVFPIFITFIIKWAHSKNVVTTIKISLLYFLAYTIHPNLALICLYFVIIYFFVNFKREMKDYKFYFLWLILLLPLMSWYFGSLFIAQKYTSWASIYSYLRDFYLQFRWKSFFGFWMSTREKQSLFYLGTFGLITAFIAVYKKNPTLKLFKVTFIFSLSLLIAGFTLLKVNTYRVDLLLNLSIALLIPTLLSQKKYIIPFIIFIFAIIIEQTWYARPLSSQHYVPSKMISDLQSTILRNQLKERQYIDIRNRPTVFTPYQLKHLSSSYFLDSFGFLELSPHHLGRAEYLAHHGLDNNNLAKFFKLMGIPKVGENLDQIRRFESFTIVKTKDYATFIKFFKSEIENNTEVPLYSFQKTKMENTEFVKVDQPIFLTNVYYHPRVRFRNISKENLVVIEPGIIASRMRIANLDVTYQFLWWEKILGFVSLSFFMMYLLLIKIIPKIPKKLF